jgi:hypothetical protein
VSTLGLGQKLTELQNHIFHVCAEGPSEWISTNLDNFGDIANFFNHAEFHVGQLIGLKFAGSKFACSHRKAKSFLILHCTIEHAYEEVERNRLQLLKIKLWASNVPLTASALITFIFYSSKGVRRAGRC